jgi:predicted flap endonuclease-1-like 5' DNA nuclease
MSRLEVELAEVRQKLAARERSLAAAEARAREIEQRAPAKATPEAAALQQELHKLEAALRDRTEELNRMRWREEMAAREGSGPAPENASRVLLVLNQQLDDARAENHKLLARIRELEHQTASAREPRFDDLTRIQGLGPKLAAQLRELDYHSFADLAALDPAALESEDHPLHKHRARILREAWIEQAADLAVGSE